ncbi:riboflavin synthase [Pseudactinotalea suaedae]|uniref:riboflavin synthase n=1 Tax=Pseudactinotalea suaedae TaxID=1524924 RepID=UPI0012E0E774|nr:riboflavin synthase [Pseudactinotalea suaedae]
MFTGIIEELGRVRAVDDSGGDALRITIEASTTLADAALGDSIAVDGCCLTIAFREATTWTAEVMGTTLAATTLGGRRAGDLVNLERAVTAQQRLGGHIVQGHVDGVGTLLDRRSEERWDLVVIGLPADGALDRYLVDKGSIAVDGVSLTVVSVAEGRVTIGLIPETLARTTLGRRRVGDRVNLEVDVLAKHVERLLSWRQTAELAP